MCAAVAVVTLGMLVPCLRTSPSRGVSPEALVMRLALPKPEAPAGDRHGGVTDERHLAYRRHSARRGAGCRMGMPEPTPSSGILLQEATPEMLADVALLRTKIFYPEMLESPYNKYLQAKSFVEAMQQKTAVLVALAPHADADDELDLRKLQKPRSAMATVGSADLVIEAVGGGGAPLAYVTNVCVLAEARRQGLGSRLMDLAEARSLAAGARELVLHVDEGNGPARRLYEDSPQP